MKRRASPFNRAFATFPKDSLYLAVDYRKLKLVS